MISLKKSKTATRLALFNRLLFGRCDPEKAILMTGAPRSGTTWLGNLLSEVPAASTLFEPLHVQKVPQTQEAGLTWRMFVPPELRWPDGEEFFQQVFSGRILNEWTTREMTIWKAFSTKFLVVKCVRANRMLPWICERFPIRSPVLLIRHPCAVVASQLRLRAWRNAPRPTAEELEPILPGVERILQNLNTHEEFLAAGWALDNAVPLMLGRPGKWQLVSYEQLLVDTEQQLQRLFDTWDLDAPTNPTQLAKRPSSTSNPDGSNGLAGWKNQLTPSLIHRILDVVHQFGFDCFTDDVEPDYDRLQSYTHSHNLQFVRG